MQAWLGAVRDPLTQSVIRTLKENVAHNRSGLAPFRLPHIAKQLISGLIDFATREDAAAADALGKNLGGQGLALRSLLATGKVLVREALTLLQTEPEASAERVLKVQDFMAALTQSLATWEMMDVRHQRDEMQMALERLIQSRENELRDLIQQLSTPLMPVYDKVLVVPLIGQIDSERSQKITERMLAAVSERQARIVIVDITGVPSVDAQVAAALVGTAQAVQLLGARVVLVGISPEIARAIVELGIELAGMPTLANLQKGIEYALRQRGLAVRPRSPKQISRRDVNAQRGPSGPRRAR